MPTNEIVILFLWLTAAAAVSAVVSVEQLYNTPEVREAREYNSALILAAQQPARRKARINRLLGE